MVTIDYQGRIGNNFIQHIVGRHSLNCYKPIRYDNSIGLV